jgi:hypothetical protein
MNNRRRRQQKLESMLKSQYGTKAIVHMYQKKVLGAEKAPKHGLLASDMIPRILEVEFANLRP